jgi:hypothetical protein
VTRAPPCSHSPVVWEGLPVMTSSSAGVGKAGGTSPEQLEKVGDETCTLKLLSGKLLIGKLSKTSQHVWEMFTSIRVVLHGGE